MAKLWNWVNSMDCSKEWKSRIFLALNCIKYCCIGFIAWLFVSKVALNSYDWAICFIGYPGFFIGYLGGILYLCVDEERRKG